MFTHTITYEDWDDNQVTEKLYFNLSKVELVELNVNWEGGLEKTFERLQKGEDQRTMFLFINTLLLKSYGVKSDDGREFMKSDEITKKFTQSRAYETIFTMLGEDDKFGEAFIRGVFPKSVIEEYDKQETEKAALPPPPEGTT
jgi:hypothetical protein